MFESYTIAFLEVTFILISLMFLHRLRKVIGIAPFYLGLGATLVFGQLVAASGLRIIHEIPALSINIGPVIFIAPFMAMLLITYVVDGTLAAQRLIWGLLFLVGIIYYLSFITEKQMLFPYHEVNYDIFQANYGASKLFVNGRFFVFASLLSFLIEFLLLPIIYEILRQRKMGMLVSVLGALVFTQVIDVLFFELVMDPLHPYWWDKVRHAFIIRATVMLWLAILTWIYLKMREATVVHDSSSRKPLDLVSTFFGAYGQSQKLAANVREWEGRYRILFENNHDLIFLVGEDGVVLDANNAAIIASGQNNDSIHQTNIESVVAGSFAWKEIWDELFENKKYTWTPAKDILSRDIVMQGGSGEKMILEATVSPIFVRQQYAALVSARDVTHRKELENELQNKQNQLMHSQRMEAVGTLAGGIAHDFNNLLQAIQGSLDSLKMELSGDPGKSQYLSNINNATKRAAGLTGQLLGFARGGKYQIEKLVMNRLIKDVEQLFLPIAGKKVTFKAVQYPEPMVVEGDVTQLQQIIFNLLLNARDALPVEGGKIICRLEPVVPQTAGFELGGEGLDPKDYLVVRVRDTGCGMDEETQSRIFEPFFTTKGTSGTGMGLAMVYGCIQNHNGWIHVTSTPGSGSEFFVFLPLATDRKPAEPEKN